MHAEIQAAAFALGHRTLGEDVGAAVVLRPGASVAEGELRDFVAGRLASFKVPQRIMFLDRMPRNAIGKIDRPALSEAADRREAEAGRTEEARTDLERRLAKIWAEELGVPSIGLDVNFFTAGGDSLSGVRLFLSVEKSFGRPLPERVLTRIATVREMARLIEEADGEEEGAEAAATELTETERRSLAAVMAMGSIPAARHGSAMKAANLAGSRPPLFWCFNSPAKEMGGLMEQLDPDQPLYGLYSGGKLFPRTEETLAKLARFYANEIISLLPEGPYVIGGNCQGAKVAVRIALNLVASGRRVDKLCLLEHSEPSLHDFDGELLLLFGKQSKLKAYRAIRWGRPGWRGRFRRPPRVEWVSGAHGKFFRTHNVPSLSGRLEWFLRGASGDLGVLNRVEKGVLMAMHAIPAVFWVYAKVLRIRERMMFRKDVKINPFTGRPLE